MLDQLFLLGDVDISLYTDQQFKELIEWVDIRSTAMRAEFKPGKLLPGQERAEAKHILKTMDELERENLERPLRLN